LGGGNLEEGIQKVKQCPEPGGPTVTCVKVNKKKGGGRVRANSPHQHRNKERRARKNSSRGRSKSQEAFQENARRAKKGGEVKSGQWAT